MKRPKPQPGDVRDRRFLDDRSAAAQSLQSAPRNSSASANPASPALTKVGSTSKKGGRKDRVSPLHLSKMAVSATVSIGVSRRNAWRDKDLPA